MLITGQRGEIGEPLCKLLRMKGVSVSYLDDISNHIGSEKRLVHLAARNASYDALAIRHSNIDYLAEVLNTAEQLGIEEFIFVSSASVYGAANSEKLSEDADLIGDSAYARSKIEGEAMVNAYPGRSLTIRIPGALELRKQTNFLSRSFVRLQENAPVSISNSHRLFNNYIHIPEFAAFLSRVSLFRDSDVINLAAKRDHSLADIIHMLRTGLNSRSPILPDTKATPFFNLDIDRACHDYGYQPDEPARIIKDWIHRRIAPSTQP